MFKLKKIAFSLLFAVLGTQSYGQLSQNWFNEDPSTDQYAGVSSDVAYAKLLAGKKSTTVIVAVIDGGTEIDHPDLKANIWTNENEIPDNGIDDDNNGYVDDVHGWNFIGGKDGDVEYDNLEAIRLYKKYKPLYEGKSKSGLNADQKKEFALYKKVQEDIAKERKQDLKGLEVYSKLKKQLDDLKLAIGKETFTAEDVENYHPTDESFNKLKGEISAAMKRGVTFDVIYDDIYKGYKQFSTQINYQLNAEYDSRAIVGDNYEDLSDRFYGNNSLEGPDGMHGTHVAGIIGAVRDNDIGIKGVAENVKLMILRVVPDGDERDKDVANAIRYAADNGAKVINMSFGKSYSPDKKYVDEAVSYAASKDVLMIHGAGNESTNNDKVENFPNPFYETTKTREPAWMDVGAISSSGNVAGFSNYGKKNVDVFAPGVSIYSTVSDGKYENLDGTSMASPVVAGVAALIRSYYPTLTAPQVRLIIMESVIKLDIKTRRPGSKKKVKFTSLSASGGIVNAYRALKTAEALVNLKK